MGFFSKKSTAVQNTEANQLGFSEVDGQAVGIVGSGNTITDAGSIAGAFDLGRYSIEQNSSLAREVIGANNQAVAGFGEQLQGFAKLATADQGDQLAQLGRWAIGGAVVIGAAYFMRGKK